MIRPEGWEALSYGAKKSTTLKRFIINNCNLIEEDNFKILSVGLSDTVSIEYVDF